MTTPLNQLQFIDEVGCPLPAGVQVSIYSVSSVGAVGTLVGQDFTVVGGYLEDFTVPNNPNGIYLASFYGNEAPNGTVIFGPGGLPAFYDSGYRYDTNYIFDNGVVTVPKYRSPVLTSQQYANAGCLLQPTGWYSQSALNTGGVLHAVMRGALAPIAADDASAQQIQEQLRLQSCQGGEIDTWGLDFVGPMFQRFTKETDEEYQARLMIMIGRPRCTINAIQAMCQAFYNSTANEGPNPLAGQLGFDVAGGYNVSGAFDTNPPQQGAPNGPVFVWDGQTQPGLAAALNVNPLQFVIQIGALVVTAAQLLAFNVAGGFDVSGAFDVSPRGRLAPLPTPTPPDPRLGVIISVIAKAAGTTPLYIYGPGLQE